MQSAKELITAKKANSADLVIDLLPFQRRLNLPCCCAVPMADEPQPCAWRPGDAIQDSSSLADIISALGFGRVDATDWMAIKDKLVARGCTTVSQVRDEWSAGELVSLIRPMKPRSHPRVYITAIGSAIGRDLFKEEASKVKCERGEAAAGQGAEWHLHCTKVAKSTDFNSSKYKPDGRVFAQLPRKGAQDRMSQPEEELAVDLLWLDAHVNPEASIGDYLPPGIPFQLGKICDELLPPFPAFLGRPCCESWSP